jgi:hypothetical protein
MVPKASNVIFIFEAGMVKKTHFRFLAFYLEPLLFFFATTLFWQGYKIERHE